jgi:dTDP-4-amino-4,6-dideoxygalactose transaminase
MVKRKSIMKVPFLNFSPMHSAIKAEIHDAFDRVYDSNWLILGKELERFEKDYAKFNKVDYCIGVSNGLDALHLALRALGISEGDEVIVPSNTYIATALAVTYVGAKPIFVEPKIDTYNIDPDLIEQAITTKTKAIMPVHLYGQACEMESIMAIAAKYGLTVIEDNAQAQGSSYNDKLTGTWGKANGTSFYPGKNLGALGDAGAVTTSDQNVAEMIRMLRNYGSQKKYYNEVVGYNMRMDEMQAAFLSTKLKKLEEWTLERQKIASWYNLRLMNLENVVLPQIARGSTHVYHLYVIRIQHRDRLQAYLTECGVGTLIHYPIPPHMQGAYQSLGYHKGDFPISEEIASTCLSLPIWPGMTATEVDYVSDLIHKFYSRPAAS